MPIKTKKEQTLCLCAACSEGLKKLYSLTELKRDRPDERIICAFCRSRVYGGKYLVRDKAKNN